MPSLILFIICGVLGVVTAQLILYLIIGHNRERKRLKYESTYKELLEKEHKGEKDELN